jgi:hypothetical protein
MSRWIARDARPQIQTLLIALAVTIVLGFIPFAGFLTYPFRLFVTFIHEGGHAIAALLTGGHVQSLQVAPNGSGLVYAAVGGRLAQMFLASAGYLGARLDCPRSRHPDRLVARLRQPHDRRDHDATLAELRATARLISIAPMRS